MTVELAGQGKFTKLVSYHILSHIYRDMILAIMDSERVPYHLREDRAGSGPGLDYLLVLLITHGGDLFDKALIDIGTFF